MNRVKMNGRAMFGDCFFLPPPQFSPSWGGCRRLTAGPLLQGTQGSTPRALGKVCPGGAELLGALCERLRDCS